jgi:uncharacterized protein (TIGR03435 family)
MTLLTKMAIGGLLLPVAAFSQDSPRFDSASVKPSKTGERGYSIRPLPGRLSIGNTTLRLMIAAAYHVNDFQISGGPKWLDSERYDIEAKAAADALPTERQMMGMLQQLLADRFGLAIHRETKDLPRYSLELAKGGPKFQASTDQGAPEFRVFQRRQITARRSTLEPLLGAMAWLLGRPVLDKTGLTGLYDYKLEWTPDQVQLASDETSGRPVDENVPSLTSALQEQMGLRLQSQKGPVEIIVVDRAEKPTAN